MTIYFHRYPQINIEICWIFKREAKFIAFVGFEIHLHLNRGVHAVVRVLRLSACLLADFIYKNIRNFSSSRLKSHRCHLLWPTPSGSQHGKIIIETFV